MSASAALIAEVARRVLMPREAETVDAFADRTRFLADGAEAGRWRTDRTPYWRYPMRIMGHRRVSRVSIGAASQTGKTTSVENAVAYWFKNDPANVMWMWPTEEGSGFYNKTKFTPAVEASPEWAAMLRTQTADDKQGLMVQFVGGLLLFRGSNAQAKSRGVACKYRLADEIDAEEFERERLHDLEQRGAAYPGGKTVLTSIPGDENDGIDLELKSAAAGGALHRYHVPCPHCATYQVLTFEHLRWEGGARPENKDHARATACYACPHCGSAIREHDKPWMLGWGVWVPNSATIEGEAEPGWIDRRPRDGESGLKPLPGVRVEYAAGGVEPERPAPHMGFGHLSALYSPWVEWGQIAYDWCQSGGQVAKTFVNGVLAEAWSPKGEGVDVEDCLKLCLPVEVKGGGDAGLARLNRRLGAYRLGEIPEPPADAPEDRILVLTGGIDLQRDCAYWVVRGWSQKLVRSWLLGIGKIKCPMKNPGESAAELERLVLMKFGSGASAVRASRWAIDSGDGLRTGEVYSFARQWPGRVLACKGASGPVAYVTEVSTIDKYGDPPKRIPGGVQLLKVNTHHFKGQMLGRLRQVPGDVNVGYSRWFWPDGEQDAHGNPVGELIREYFAHVTAEHYVVTNQPQVNRGARPVRAWRKRPGRSANHWLDADGYACAAAAHAFANLTNEQYAGLVKKAMGPQAADGATDNATTTRLKGRSEE